MASSQGIRAGRAFVELFTDNRKLVRGLRAAEKKLKNFGRQIRGYGLKLAGLGSAMLAPLAASAKLFSGYGDQVAKMARRTGLSVEALSQLQFVASQTGTSLQALEAAMRRMQRSIYDAGRGLSTQTDALADLGLTYQDLAGLAPEQQFEMLAEAISRIPDASRKAALAQALFGRAGTQLLPMMASGADGIAALREEADRLGLTMSGKDAKAAEEFTDALDRLWKTVKMGVFHVGAALAPTLQAVADRITAVVGQVSHWIQQNRQLIVNVLQVATGLVVAGAAVVALGGAISGMGATVGALAGIIGTAVAALKVLAGAVALLISPIGLVIGAMAGLGAVVLHVTGAGAKALAWLGERFGELKAFALDAFGGIRDALVAGDFKLAARILWLTLQVAWQRGIQFLKEKWIGFKASALEVFSQLAAGVRVAWTETVAFFQRSWVKLKQVWAKGVEGLANLFARGMLHVRGALDDSFDVEAAIAHAHDQSLQAIRSIDAEAAESLDAIESARQARLDRIGADHAAELKGIRLQHDRELSKTGEKLKQARAEWQKAIEAARQGRQDAGQEDPGAEPESPDSLLDRLRLSLDSLPGAIEHAARPLTSTRGTFSGSAAALRSLSGGESRMLQASEETAKNTRRMEQHLAEFELTFT